MLLANTHCSYPLPATMTVGNAATAAFIAVIVTLLRCCCDYCGLAARRRRLLAMVGWSVGRPNSPTVYLPSVVCTNRQPFVRPIFDRWFDVCARSLFSCLPNPCEGQNLRSLLLPAAAIHCVHQSLCRTVACRAVLGWLTGCLPA